MENNLVTQSNTLIEACYSMTINEQRLLMACISKIDSRQILEDGKEFVITVQEAQDLFFQEADRKNSYHMLRLSAERLFRREARIHLDENRELLTHFVQQVIFDKEKKEIRVLFAKGLKPYLSQLEGHFTSYKLKNIVQLKSAYAVRFYQLLCEWQGQGMSMHILDFDKINKMLSTPYKLFGDFKKKVLDVAVEQINIYTDFQVEYSLKKTGRKVSHIQLHWQMKEKPENIEQRKIENEKAKAIRLKQELEETQRKLHFQALDRLSSLPIGTTFIDDRDNMYILKELEPLEIGRINHNTGYYEKIRDIGKFADNWFLNGTVKIINS